MGFFKRLFSKKKEVVVEEVPQSDSWDYSIKIPREKIRECFGCGRQILPTEKITKQGGNFYHRKCWKRLKSQSPF